jgi:hypothetical protein
LAISGQALILMLSVGMYLSAFAAPFDGSSKGLAAFWCGLVFCLVVPYTTPWWANVLYWVALGYFCRKRWSAASKWGLSATALGGAFIFLNASVADALAFQLWVGSMALLGFGALRLACGRLAGIR